MVSVPCQRLHAFSLNSIVGNLYFEVKIARELSAAAVRLIILQFSSLEKYMTVSVNNELDLLSQVS